MGDEEEDPFGMGAPPLAEASASPLEDDPFGAVPSSFEASPTIEDAPVMPDMNGDFPDVGGGLQDMGSGLLNMDGMGGGDMPPMGGMDMGGGMGSEFAAPMEMGAVANWRVEQQAKMAAKAQAAQEAASTKIAEAQDALQQFYAERVDKVAKRAAENRAAEASYVEERDAAMIADSWDSVCKLVDLKEKAGAEVDTSRMRSLLTQLKHDS